MTFRARYRFKLVSPLDIKNGAPLNVTLPDLPVVTFEMGEEAHPAGHWVIATIDGFETENEARKVGRQLGDTLLVVGAVMKLGIDIGFSRTTQHFSKAVHDAVRAKTGRELRTETHGLMVYEKNTVNILGMQARGSVLIGSQVFAELLDRWTKPSLGLSERQRNCAALINDSFFVTQIEGQFILRISAVEALCDQAAHNASYRAAIEELERHLAEQALDDEIRESVQRTLANAKRQSLRQAYMTKFTTLRSAAEAKAFDDLYKMRSKLVHDGIGRGTLNEASNAALLLATDLLDSELNHTQPES